MAGSTDVRRWKPLRHWANRHHPTVAASDVGGTLLGSINDPAGKCRAAKDTLMDSLLRLELCLAKSRAQRPRRSMRPSGKLAYIGHSYHEKTKSSAFLVEYLSQYFDIEMILDAGWSGLPLQDLSFLDETYAGVIFFQSQPTPNLVNQIRNENVIFVPMYDSDAWRGYGYWRQFRGLRVISFSSTLHKRLMKWGFETMHIQYFPKPCGFVGGSANEIFFWQRVSAIDVSMVARLFAGADVTLHVHRALDPHQTFVEPSSADAARLGITYSNWFDTREQMLELVRDRGIFIAPREREGIGMSFLEAMAMGKAVVAVDNPTMNEYIEHGRTGYLFSLRDPEKIDFGDIHNVQRNAYDRVCRGYEEWESSKRRIIEFISAR